MRIGRNPNNWTFATKYPRKFKPASKKRPVAPAVKKPSIIPVVKKRIPQQKKPAALPNRNLTWDSSKELKDYNEPFEFKVDSFKHFGLVDELVTNLKYAYPSKVQQGMISTSLGTNKNILVGSQTGTGKTLGYLLPIFHALKKAEQATSTESTTGRVELIEQSSGSSKHNANSPLINERKLKRPRAIVLVPTRQLVSQVTLVAKEISHECRMRVVGIHSKTKHLNDLLETPIDILVTTPTTLLNMMKENDLNLNRVHKMVYDEIDTLFDRNFSKDTLKVLASLKEINEKKGTSVQSTLVTATISKPLEKEIREHFGDIVMLIAPSLHKTPTRCHQEFITFNQSITKFDLLRGILRKGISQTNRVLVFCNTVKTVNQVYDSLKEKKYPCYKISSDMLYKDLDASFKDFLKEDGEFKILVATDVASRGLDTTQVGIVVNYDFPTTIIDYVHRVGRTARFGERGRAFSIVGKKDIPLAERIQEKVKRGLPLTA